MKQRREEKRGQPFAIRFYKDELQNLAKASDLDGMTMSGFIRQLIVRRVREQKKEGIWE